MKQRTSIRIDLLGALMWWNIIILMPIFCMWKRYIYCSVYCTYHLPDTLIEIVPFHWTRIFQFSFIYFKWYLMLFTYVMLCGNIMWYLRAQAYHYIHSSVNLKSNSIRNIWYFICYLKYVTAPAIRMIYVHKLYLKW